MNFENPRGLTSTLWVFVLLNMLFRDIHEFAEPGFVADLASGVANSMVTQELLLVAGIMLEIPIAAVVLSRLLVQRAARWFNLGAAPLFTLIMFAANTPGDLDDYFFTTMQVIGLILVFVTAWRWKTETV